MAQIPTKNNTALMLICVAVVFLTATCNRERIVDEAEDINLLYKNGVTAMKAKMLNGDFVGPMEYYYPSGRLMIRAISSENHEDFFKEFRQYNEFGRLVVEEFEEQTNQDGYYRFISKQFDDLGRLSYESKTEVWISHEEGHEDEDQKVTVREYYANGNLQTLTIISGHTRSESWYDVDGQFVGTVVERMGKYSMSFEEEI